MVCLSVNLSVCPSPTKNGDVPSIVIVVSFRSCILKMGSLPSDLEDSEYVPMLPPAVVDSTTAPILITSAPRTPASMGIPVPAVSLGHSHRRATPPSAGNQVLRMTPPPAGLNTSVSSSPGSTSSIGGTFYPRGSSGSNTLLAR
jgi:hypothetical protein